MFTVEIKINGAMIGHIYGINIGSIEGETGYNYEYYRPESRKLVCGKVTHKRNEGIEKLIQIILEDYTKKS